MRTTLTLDEDVADFLKAQSRLQDKPFKQGGERGLAAGHGVWSKVRDEIRTGNLAIDGAKNFGRFEAFFPAEHAVGAGPRRLLGAYRIPRRARRGGRALEARLSDAFNRFLEGVPDNRQVAFDDN